MVLTVNGMPAAEAALTKAMSACGHASAAMPVGAITKGSADGAPRMGTDRSRRDTSTKIRGMKVTDAKSAMFRRMAVSVSAPPSM